MRKYSSLKMSNTFSFEYKIKMLPFYAKYFNRMTETNFIIKAQSVLFKNGMRRAIIIRYIDTCIKQ